MSRRFAAFIMTYERPAILRDTINKILCQSLAPEKILVVDNSVSYDTEELIQRLDDSRVAYYRVGFNGGPAMAAKIGLKIFAEEGFEWIYWADDDNPPQFDGILEALITEGERLLRDGKRVGAVGVSGSLYNKFTGMLERIPANQLNGMVEVTTIPGNAKFIIHAQVIKEGLLPHEELFFGFEELEYALQMRQQGFSLYCHGPLLLRHRKMFRRPEKISRSILKENDYQFRRRYYSYRNLLYIMMFRHRNYWTSFVLLVRWLIRVIADGRFGFRYFIKSFTVFKLAVSDAFHRRLGLNKSVAKNL